MDLDFLKLQIKEMEKSLEVIRAVFVMDELENRVKELQNEQQKPDFYSDSEHVQQVGKELNSVEQKIKKLSTTESRFAAFKEVVYLCEENDTEILTELSSEYEMLSKTIESMRLIALLRGKYDNSAAILSIQAGAGGTEAQDWAEMLLRMYKHYADKQGFGLSTLDFNEGDSAGIKSVTIKIDGENAYGFLKSESGVHRLVRISPFDSNARRHTSFASVDVMPEIDKNVEVEIKDSDIRIDTFHSGGNGGQGVNTTDSAVRIKHLPTGIIVQCQNERSQIQNRETAFAMLRSKLVKIKEEQHLSSVKDIQGNLKKIEWGSQIRSYVFQPYTMVKDHRSNYETSDINSFMDGNIQPCIEEYLKKTDRGE